MSDTDYRENRLARGMPEVRNRSHLQHARLCKLPQARHAFDRARPWLAPGSQLYPWTLYRRLVVALYAILFAYKSVICRMHYVRRNAVFDVSVRGTNISGERGSCPEVMHVWAERKLLMVGSALTLPRIFLLALVLIPTVGAAFSTPTAVKKAEEVLRKQFPTADFQPVKCDKADSCEIAVTFKSDDGIAADVSYAIDIDRRGRVSYVNASLTRKSGTSRGGQFETVASFGMALGAIGIVLPGTSTKRRGEIAAEAARRMNPNAPADYVVTDGWRFQIVDFTEFYSFQAQRED